MYSKINRIVGYAAVAAFSAFGAICTIMVVAQLPNWGDKKPEWIGALGTIAAFAGTIWIATSETRRKRQDDLTRARLRAAGMMLRVVNAKQAVAELVEKLEVAALVDVAPAEIISYGEPLAKLDLWQMQEVELLVPLPNNTSVLLALAVDEIISATRSFERAAGGGVLTSADTRRSFVAYHGDLLEMTSRNLDKCVVECLRARQLLHQPTLDLVG